MIFIYTFVLKQKYAKVQDGESSAKNFNVLLKFPDSHGSFDSASLLSKSHAQTVEIF